MRRITHAFVHCSASPRGRPDRAEDIERWHLERWGRAGKRSGYHEIVELDGRIRSMRPPHIPGIHAGRYNPNSLAVCYVGGVEEDVLTPADTRTPEQVAAIDRVLREWIEEFGVLTIKGHNEVAPRACPSYDVQLDLASRGFWDHLGGTPEEIDPHDPRYRPQVDRSTLAGRTWRRFLGTLRGR